MILGLGCALSGCDAVFSLSARDARDAGDLDAPGDGDADGVLDSTDNCAAIANADQHDEDHDGIGDVCDNCPHLANADQANTQEAPSDDLGDACDGEATTQCIVMFDPFTQRPGTIAKGDWPLVTDGDSIVQQDFGEPDGMLLLSDGLYAAEVIVAGARVEFFASNDLQFHRVGIWHATDFGISGPLMGVVAQYSDAQTASSNGPAVLDVRQPSVPATVGTANFDAAVTMATAGVGAEATLQLDMRTPRKVSARATVATTTAVLQAGSLADLLPAGRVGFRTENTRARFTYVLVYQDSGAACPARVP